MENKKQNEYKTGYKKPPKETQFKPGQSGNPKGRPKGSQNEKTKALNMQIILEDILGEPIPITIRDSEGNTIKKDVSKIEAIINRLTQNSMQGCTKSISQLIKFLEKTELFTINKDLDEKGNKRYGYLAVPGVAKSVEEWEREYGNGTLNNNNEENDKPDQE